MITKEQQEKFANALQQEMDLYYDPETNEDENDWLEGGYLHCELDDWCVGVQTSEGGFGMQIAVTYHPEESKLDIELFTDNSENATANKKVVDLFNEVKVAGMTFADTCGQIRGKVQYDNVVFDDLTEKFRTFKEQFNQSLVWIDILSVMPKQIRRNGGYRICYDD